MTLLELTTVAALLSLGHVAPEHTHCWCDSARVQNGWCDPCEVGYIGGITVRHAEVVEAMDTAGHPVDVTSLECASCRETAAVDGICPVCDWGIAGERIYASKLTYYLALARSRVDEPDLPGGSDRPLCLRCRSTLPSDPPHWCDPCNRGTIATFVFHDAATFAAAQVELTRFRAALGEAERCQSCAIGGYFGTACPTHRQ